MIEVTKRSKILRCFGESVRAVRTQQGISQEHLGELASLDRTYISGVERGVRNISLMNIAAIAEALGVTIANLMKGL